MIRELLTESSGEYVLLNARKSWDVHGYFDDPKYYTIREVVPKKIMDLVDDIFVPFMDIGEKDQAYSREVVPYDECDLDAKQMIKEKELKIRKILESNNPELDRPINFSIQIFDNPGNKGSVIFLEKHKLTQCEFTATPRELAEAGILPEDLELSRRKITSKDMAQATKAKEVTKSEEKGIWGKLVDKVKCFFNEKVK